MTHSFIMWIYIAPLQGYYSEMLPTLAWLKRAVLWLWLLLQPWLWLRLWLLLQPWLWLRLWLWLQPWLGYDSDYDSDYNPDLAMTQTMTHSDYNSDYNSHYDSIISTKCDQRLTLSYLISLDFPKKFTNDSMESRLRKNQRGSTKINPLSVRLNWCGSV